MIFNIPLTIKCELLILCPPTNLTRATFTVLYTLRHSKIGLNDYGNVGGNESGSSLSSRTRVKSLSCDVIWSMCRYTGSTINDVPMKVATIGIGTLMESEEVSQYKQYSFQIVFIINFKPNIINHFYK